MNIKIPEKAVKILSKAQGSLSKHSPEIWLGAGIVAIIGGTIWACQSSRKVDRVIEVHQEDMDALKNALNEAEEMRTEAAKANEEFDDSDLMTVKQYKTECIKCTMTTVGDFFYLYGPSVLLIAGGIGMIINGHRILCQRNATLLAAYSTLETSFAEYRKRVSDRYGADVENDIYTGTTYTTETHTEVDENGKKKKVKENIAIPGASVSPYATMFSHDTTTEWTNSPDYNRTFLLCQQNIANNQLHSRGHLFLNEVYDLLGIDHTSTGAVCGWILPEHPTDEADEYIDFGIVDPRDETGDILLDFNCQGLIYDKI